MLDLLGPEFGRTLGLPPDELEHAVNRIRRKVIAEVPSAFEDPMTYAAISLVVADVEQVLREIGAAMPARPVLIGTVPTGRVNAVTLVPPGHEEHVVLFDSGLFAFTGLLGKALSQCLPIVGDDGDNVSLSADLDTVREHVRSSREGIARLGELIFAYVLAGSPHAAPRYPWSGKTDLIGNYLIATMERFLVAHEYGHVVQDDHAQELRRRFLNDTDEVTYSWGQEAAADIFGARVAVQAALDSGSDLSVAYTGVEITFGALELVERAVSVVKHGRVVIDDAGSATHPPLRERRQMLRDFFPSMVTKAQADMAADAMTAAQDFADVLDLLWSEMEPAFVSLFDRKFTAHPMWGT